ncbi:MAG: hypothetical protein WBF87_05255 [Mesorhizobium sp.]
MSDLPPTRQPSYFSGGWFRMGTDEPQFRVKPEGGFEFFSSEESDPPHLAAPVYAEEMARAVVYEARWIVTGGWIVTPGEINGRNGSHRVAFTAGHEATRRSVSGEIIFSADPSHWVKVEVYLGPFRVFLAFLEHVWEEFELWPADSPADGESPGRIGKRKNWVNLPASAWPQITHVSGEDYLAVEAPED